MREFGKIILGIIAATIIGYIFWLLGGLVCIIFPSGNLCGGIGETIFLGVIFPAIGFILLWILYLMGDFIVDLIIKKFKKDPKKESCGGPYR